MWLVTLFGVKKHTNDDYYKALGKYAKPIIPFPFISGLCGHFRTLSVLNKCSRQRAVSTGLNSPNVVLPTLSGEKKEASIHPAARIVCCDVSEVVVWPLWGGVTCCLPNPSKLSDLKCPCLYKNLLLIIRRWELLAGEDPLYRLSMFKVASRLSGPCAGLTGQSCSLNGLAKFHLLSGELPWRLTICRSRWPLAISTCCTGVT